MNRWEAIVEIVRLVPERKRRPVALFALTIAAIVSVPLGYLTLEAGRFVETKLSAPAIKPP